MRHALFAALLLFFPDLAAGSGGHQCDGTGAEVDATSSVADCTITHSGSTVTNTGQFPDDHRIAMVKSGAPWDTVIRQYPNTPKCEGGCRFRAPSTESSYPVFLNTQAEFTATVNSFAGRTVGGKPTHLCRLGRAKRDSNGICKWIVGEEGNCPPSITRRPPARPRRRRQPRSRTAGTMAERIRGRRIRLTRMRPMPARRTA